MFDAVQGMEFHSVLALRVSPMLTGPTQEDDMYTRNVSLKLKASPFSASEFTDIVDREIIPLLRKQTKRSASSPQNATKP